jgi:transposase
MNVCILDQAGTKLVHKNLPTTPEAFLRGIAPYRDDLVMAVECIVTWYWLADLCQPEGIAFVLGHALYMKAIQGGKAKNDKVDADKLAVLVRGGMLPQASVYPAEMRATRDLLRRRCHLVRKRAELLAYLHHTKSQSNLPEIEKRLTHKANREGVEEHFPAPSVRKTIEGEVFPDWSLRSSPPRGRTLPDAQRQGARRANCFATTIGPGDQPDLGLGPAL